MLCERCGREYEPSTVFIRDNFADLVAHVLGEYSNLCKPCRAAEHPEQAFVGAPEP